MVAGPRVEPRRSCRPTVASVPTVAILVDSSTVESGTFSFDRSLPIDGSVSMQLLDQEVVQDDTTPAPAPRHPRRRHGGPLVVALVAAGVGLAFGLAAQARINELEAQQQQHEITISKMSSDIAAALVGLRSVGNNGIGGLDSRLDDLESKVDDVESKADCLNEGLSDVSIWGEDFLYSNC